MSNYKIERATQTDNTELCQLCELPLDGNIVLALERSPDYFKGASIQSEMSEVYVCRNTLTGKIAGMFNIGKRRVFYNGSIKTIRYFSDLRIDKRYHGSIILFRMCRFIIEQNILESGFAQTIIFEENTLMLNLVNKLQQRRKNFTQFNYYDAGNYRSYMIKLGGSLRSKSSRFEIRKANENDIPKMQELLLHEGAKKTFYPYYEFKKTGTDYFEGLSLADYYLAFDEGKLVGITGTWDQKEIKQTKIVNYSKTYSLLKPLVNLWAFISGGFMLPDKGTVLNYLSLHTILVSNNNPEIFTEIINHVFNEHRHAGYSYLLAGLDEKDSLNKAFEGLKNKRVINGRHFLVAQNRPEDKAFDSPFYLEVSRI